jgi:hypothetical protein
MTVSLHRLRNWMIFKRINWSDAREEVKINKYSSTLWSLCVAVVYFTHNWALQVHGFKIHKMNNKRDLFPIQSKEKVSMKRNRTDQSWSWFEVSCSSSSSPPHFYSDESMSEREEKYSMVVSNNNNRKMRERFLFLGIDFTAIIKFSKILLCDHQKQE